MNILYLPIIEAGTIHDLALHNKRGLHDALVNAGHAVLQVDYLSEPQLYETVSIHIRDFAPDLLLTQLHGPDPVSADMMARWRQQRPAMRVINWSGDSWRHSLVGEAYLPLVRQFDLQLCAAPDILPEYDALGIPAGFWQIAYEAPVGPLPQVPAYDVLFLGNVISEPRRQMLEMLRGLEGVSVGIYGDWPHADGYNCYDFGTGEALYKAAKVAIADNVYPDQQNYTSNRPIQCLMAGGALLLHQHVPKMETLLGIEAGNQYIEWHTLDDLARQIRFWVHWPNTQPMVVAGQQYAQQHHTYAVRERQLMQVFWPKVERERV